MRAEDHTIQHTTASLGQDLKQYLEAQYHIRDESLLDERKRLLDEIGTVAQAPFLEATPAYELAESFSKLNLPESVKNFLGRLASFGVGIYDRPYKHQAEALEAYLKGFDVLAATGTGSGKTEIFILSILSKIVQEGALGLKPAQTSGMRALILYPMNALVADQLARVRRIFGNDEVKNEIKNARGRHATFAMYTSRTPFPGQIQNKHDEARKLRDSFYSPILNDQQLLDKLKERGKWPAKDIGAFFGKSGDRWNNLLRTHPSDAELLMRHEIQAACPDILITNYSMLEYMLLRPIEKPIFDQTAAYLKNEGTHLTVVMDEAHMYRGPTGAEVGFLLRRLCARLGVSREKLRFILTTASVGGSEKDKTSAITFAEDLTGLRRNSGQVAFIKGTKEALLSPRPATSDETRALAAFDVNKFHANKLTPALLPQVNFLFHSLGLPEVGGSDIPDAIYQACHRFGPATRLVELISGNATKLQEVADKLCPDESNGETRLKALDALVAVCNFAKDGRTGKIFLPARLHLFFRGLSGIFACIDPACSHRRSDIEPSLLGRLHPEPMVQCDCNGRVYELLTHRDCGSAFLRGYVSDDRRPEFLWHEPTTDVGKGDSLREVHIHVSAERPAFTGWEEAWIQIQSGQIVWQEPAPEVGWLKVYFPGDGNKPEPTSFFVKCPCCNRLTQRDPREPSRIMDLRTKGEQPFSQLVKRQMICQPVDTKKDPREFPNRGRKVLLFSDGRQKAARLAKNIPDEVEADGFRQLLVVTTRKITEIQKTLANESLQSLYNPFVAACSDAYVYLFEKEDAKRLRADIKTFRNLCDSNLDEYWDEKPSIPEQFKERLYKQVSGGLYSLRFMAAGWMEPQAKRLRMLARKFPVLHQEEIRSLCIAWLQDIAREGGLDQDLDGEQRARIVGFNRGNNWGDNGKIPTSLKDIIKDSGLNLDVDAISAEFLDTFCHKSEGNAYFIKPETVGLNVDFNQSWIRCKKCLELSPMAFLSSCPNCGHKVYETIDPNNDSYISSRKGYWRKPLKGAFDGSIVPLILHAEEHTAQLSHKDNTSGAVLTEKYELRFQDVMADPEEDPPVDILSCTTTMEVGIDIGSLVAVGLRNVPPQRENYQQRAGRAGRRGSAVSTVVTYCQGGAHDNHYFKEVHEIVSGAPRMLNVKVDNEKIARRHVHAYLLQSFFGGQVLNAASDVMSSLGPLEGFYFAPGPLSLDSFSSWINGHLTTGLPKEIARWVGSNLKGVDNIEVWSTNTASEFVGSLRGKIGSAQELVAREKDMPSDDKTSLLNYLFSCGLLPTYAFPTDLASFKVESYDRKIHDLVTTYQAQQSTNRSLSEYAPGRMITIDKQTFKSDVVTARVLPNVRNRAEPLFKDPHQKPYVFCNEPKCSYVEDIGGDKAAREQRDGQECPLCGIGTLCVMDLIKPEVFMPKWGKSVDELYDEDDYSYATPAQFPIHIHSDGTTEQPLQKVSDKLQVLRAEGAELVVVNKGDPREKSGFLVCDCCGMARLTKLGAGKSPHKYPYEVMENRTPKANLQCTGTWKQVFMGNRFKTDLLLLRLSIDSPLCLTPDLQSEDYLALNDALITLADCLPLAIGRRFDVDPTEFTSGYRLIQQTGGGLGFTSELYVFDNLSGGAGYSEKAGDDIRSILETEVMAILDCRDGHCDRSCYRCLRHYHNQGYHHKLDRRLAKHLLQYILSGVQPPNPAHQEKLLCGLGKMMEFIGAEVRWNSNVKGVTVPMTVSQNGQSVVVYVSNGLVNQNDVQIWADELDSPDVQTQRFNEYKLTRNLPSCFLDLEQCLKSTH